MSLRGANDSERRSNLRLGGKQCLMKFIRLTGDCFAEKRLATLALHVIC